MKDKSDVIKKVKALLARAGDAGSTEAEALKAAQVAAKLMDEHAISSAEIDQSQILYERQTVTPNHLWHEPFLFWVTTTLADFTGTYGYRSRRACSSGYDFVFYGDPADAIFAKYLAESLTNFIVAGCEDETRQRGLKGRARDMFRKGYLIAAAQRISARLRSLIAERNQRYVGTTLPALPDRSAAAKAHLLSDGRKMRRAPARRSVNVHAESIAAGERRADQAQFHRGVGQNETSVSLPGE